jgi:uncharacterized membrane protein
MNSINLLPTAVEVKTVTVKAVTFFKRMSISIVIIFLFLGLAGLAYFFIASRQLATIKIHEENLKTTLAALKETEQQYVLSKDRLAGIKEVRSKKAVEEELTKVQKLQTLLPASLTISEVEIREDGAKVSLVGVSSRDIVSFFASLLTSEIYEKIILKNFGFNPNSGFLISLEVS